MWNQYLHLMMNFGSEQATKEQPALVWKYLLFSVVYVFIFVPFFTSSLHWFLFYTK